MRRELILKLSLFYGKESSMVGQHVKKSFPQKCRSADSTLQCFRGQRRVVASSVVHMPLAFSSWTVLQFHPVLCCFSSLTPTSINGGAGACIASTPCICGHCFVSLSSSSKIRRCVPRKYSYAFGSCSRSSIIFLTFSFNLQTSWLLCFYFAFLKILLTAYLNATYLLRWLLWIMKACATLLRTIHISYAEFFALSLHVRLS